MSGTYPMIEMDAERPAPVWECPRCAYCLDRWKLSGDPAAGNVVLLTVECRHCGHSMGVAVPHEDMIAYDEEWNHEDDPELLVSADGRAGDHGERDPGDGPDEGRPRFRMGRFFGGPLADGPLLDVDGVSAAGPAKREG